MMKTTVLLLVGCCLFAFSTLNAAAKRPFAIFDGLLYAGKPDPGVNGLVPIVWIGDLWRPGTPTGSVDEIRVRSEFERFKDSSGYYYLDIENWPLLSVPNAMRTQNIEKLMQVLDLAHRTAPRAHVGFYGLLPGITYWPLFRRDAAYQEWLQVNRDLDPLAAQVDAIYPSVYTYYDDLPGWKKYAAETLKEARRYGKPVYAFVWPQFHDSNPELRGRNVSAAFWRVELELCYELADGVVLWGGWQGRWDESAAWWQETLAFKKALEERQRSANESHP